MLVKLTGSRANFTGRLAGLNWVDGKTSIPQLSQRLIRGYGVIEDKPSKVTPLTVTIEAPALKEIVDEAIEKVKADITLEPDPDEVFVEASEVTVDINAIDSESVVETLEDGAKELADIVAAKKQEIEQAASKDTNETSLDVPKSTLKKSEVKSLDDFKGVGSWGKYKSYVKEVTGISPRNKKECAEALSTFIATLED